jgi:hypothetical protein
MRNNMHKKMALALTFGALLFTATPSSAQLVTAAKTATAAHVSQGLVEEVRYRRWRHRHYAHRHWRHRHYAHRRYWRHRHYYYSPYYSYYGAPYYYYPYRYRWRPGFSIYLRF